MPRALTDNLTHILHDVYLVEGQVNQVTRIYLLLNYMDIAMVQRIQTLSF